MNLRTFNLSSALLFSLSLSACSEAVYPSRPALTPGPVVADPPHSRVTLHVSATQGALKQLLDEALPQKGEGSFSLLGMRQYRFTRAPVELSFNTQGEVTLKTRIHTELDTPAQKVMLDFTLTAAAQPVITSDYKVEMQALKVSVESDNKLLRAGEYLGGVMGMIKRLLEAQLLSNKLDLKPILGPAYAKLKEPIVFALGNANGCLDIGVQTIEAGPNVFAGGFEKEFAFVVKPFVTLPCQSQSGGTGALPPLHNVSSIASGPYEITVPIAATYDELKRAMGKAFTGGKLFFSQEYPELYLEKPEIYASGGQIVVKMHLDGFVKKGFRVHLAGDLYLTGHPRIRDNELEIPDLEPTIETNNALLKLKTALSQEALTREVRAALRLDIGQRLLQVRNKLSNELSYTHPISQNPQSPLSACLKTDLGRVEVTGVFAHDSYMRIYVKAFAQSGIYLPCAP